VDDFYLIAGLGNPGLEYSSTRHNIGFMALDWLLKEHQCVSRKSNKSYDCYKLRVENRSLVLVRPLTYMNNSGIAINEVARYYKIPLSKTIVVHDELDLPLGRIQLKQGGGEAGHNGLKSISNCLGSKDYVRIRLGIGKPKICQGAANLDDKPSVYSWVLSNFSADELKIVTKSCNLAADAVKAITFSGFKEAQMLFNKKDK
jgi:peptidyl-tRNA hydrolase, PTH1 family